MHRQTYATIHHKQQKKKKLVCICHVLRPRVRFHGHVTLGFSWRLFNLFSDRKFPQRLIDFITVKRMRRSAFLGLKTNPQNYHSLRSGPITLLLCQCTMFEVEQIFSHKHCIYGMECWRERCVEVEFAMTRFITFRKLMKCKARNANSVVMNISIVGHYSIQPVSQDDVQTSDLNRVSFQRVSYESTSAIRAYGSALNISDISKTLSSFIYWSKSLFLT